MTEKLTAIDFYSKIKDLKVTMRAKYLYLFEQGFTATQIAEFFGKNPGSIYNLKNSPFKMSDKTKKDLEYLRSRKWL